MEKDTVYIILLVLYIFVLYHIHCYCNGVYTIEKYTEQENDLSSKLLSFITKDTTAKEYVDFLKENDNKSIKLLDIDKFYELKIAKKNGKLTKNIILDSI
jgi:hypothetical protein